MNEVYFILFIFSLGFDGCNGIYIKGENLQRNYCHVCAWRQTRRRIGQERGKGLVEILQWGSFPVKEPLAYYLSYSYLCLTQTQFHALFLVDHTK